MLNIVYVWFCKNKLKLNLIKSKFICFEVKDLNTVINNNLVVYSLNCKSDLNTMWSEILY